MIKKRPFSHFSQSPSTQPLKFQPLELPAIVFLDVDGTILNAKHEIPQATKDAIKELQQRDVKVGLATGRGTSAIVPLVKELNLSGPHIVYAGALLLDKDLKPLNQKSIDRELCEELLEWSNSNLEDFEIHYSNKFYALKETPLLRINWNYIGVTPELGPFPTNIFESPIVKFLVMYDDKDSWVREELSKKFSSKVQLAPAKGAKHKNLTFISIISALAGAPNFLEDVWSYIGKRGAFWSAGDGESDIPLMSVADVGIAMGNAHDIVKTASNYIAKHVDEDGLGLALLELISRVDGSR